MRPSAKPHPKHRPVLPPLLPPFAALLALFLGGCASIGPAPEPGRGEAVEWRALPGWEGGRQAEAWPALLATCERLGDRPPWKPLCADATPLPDAEDATVRTFLRGRFVPHRMRNGDGGDRGLITGYYEPLLEGSRQPTEHYRYPLYTPPPDLLRIRLGPRFPGLARERVRGRLTEERRVVPYYTRAEIEGEEAPLAGHELLWVDDPVDRFFLHIQGSGRVRLAEGGVVKVGYADQNGHRYVSIGKVLIERGELTREEVSLPTLRRWLENHPGKWRSLVNENPSYVFFRTREGADRGPRGSLGVPLTARRSVAVDPEHIPLGLPLWLTTRLPAPEHREEGRPYRRLVMAQDTGGAIRGPVRADLFTGQGQPGEWLAGRMKNRGRLFLLRPAWRYGPAETRVAGGEPPAEG